MASKRKDRIPPRKGKGLGMGLKVLIIVVIAIIVIAAVGVLESGPGAPAPAQVGGNVGDMAPDFNLGIVTEQGLTLQNASLSSFRGKVVLLEFMVSWCPACRQMAPTVEDLYKVYGPEGAEFLSVAGTYGGATAATTSQFIGEFHSSWTYVLDTSNLFGTYGIKATPTFFIIGREGKILARIEGGTYEELAAALTNALTGKTA
jgi:thiol-disulfide isomerase/thioredoxin